MKKMVIAVAALAVLFIVMQKACSKPYVANPHPSGTSIVCFGDSLTHGTGATPETSYPTQLAALIGREVINSGVPGNTTADALERLDRDVLAHNPKIVVITLGGNDLMRDVPKEQAFRNLKSIVEQIHDRGGLAVIGGIKVPLIDRGFAKAYKELCRSSGCVLVPDILDDIMGNDALMSDQIHPNARGYEVMAERFHRAMKPYLQ